MILRMRENPWRLMLAVNVAVLIGVFFYKITREPYVPYIHLLVDYHFGFTKRALIGAMVSLFFAKVPVSLVFALSGAVWLNTLGHFDIYGCAFAICLLLVPARSIVFVLLAALASTILILIHHIHLLMYVPTIAVIVVLRHYFAQGFNRQNAIVGTAAIACIGVLFFAAQFRGSLAVPEAEFVQYLQNRMADPTRTNLLSFSYIWYQPISQEIHDTWDRMPSNLLGIPVFALLIWLHAPLWKYFVGLIQSLTEDSHRRVVIAGIVAVSLAYLIMFAIVFDYSRWISNWAVCMFLILHAVKPLPSSNEVRLISTNDPRTTLFGWIVTLIPRVGIVRPF